MGRFDVDTGKFYRSDGHLAQVIFKGVIIAEDEVSPGTWKMILAKKDSFWGKLLGW